MYLGPERTAAFIRQVLDAGSYVVCHQTLSPVLQILQAGRRMTEVPPPLVAKAEELGRDAGKAAASWVFDGNTPEEEYQRVLRGIEEGDPAVLGATEPPAIGPGAGYDQDDLARDLGIEPGDRAAPGRVRLHRRLHRRLLAGNRAGRPRPRRLEPGTASITRPGEKQCPAKRGTAREKNTAIRRCGGEINLERCSREVPVKAFPRVRGQA
jgi:hypothetical protein